jgi:hypothetical protein
MLHIVYGGPEALGATRSRHEGGRHRIWCWSTIDFVKLMLRPRAKEPRRTWSRRVSVDQSSPDDAAGIYPSVVRLHDLYRSSGFLSWILYAGRQVESRCVMMSEMTNGSSECSELSRR